MHVTLGNNRPAMGRWKRNPALAEQPPAEALCAWTLPTAKSKETKKPGGDLLGWALPKSKTSSVSSSFTRPARW